jgi:methionyl aminopeptidase
MGVATVEPGEVSPERPVPERIARPDYVGGTRPKSPPLQIFTDPSELHALRRVCRVAAEVLAETGAAVAEGVTTDELDAIAHAAYIARDAYPSDLGYGTYRKSICTSVNEVVCHGIPDSRPLRNGDIVNIDVTAFLDGLHGDCSATFMVGEVDPPTRALVEATREALEIGIASIVPGKSIRVIGQAIQRFAHSRGYGVVADYGGHGIGRIFHAPPHIFHVDDRSATTVMRPGMVFTIEPMINLGLPTHDLWPDGWTVVTEDRLPSAQFEHTILVTETGGEPLTLLS